MQLKHRNESTRSYRNNGKRKGSPGGEDGDGEGLRVGDSRPELVAKHWPARCLLAAVVAYAIVPRHLRAVSPWPR